MCAMISHNWREHWRGLLALLAAAAAPRRAALCGIQAHVESFSSHLKGDWRHLTDLRGPQALDAEPAWIRREYNTIRLQAGAGEAVPLDGRA